MATALLAFGEPRAGSTIHDLTNRPQKTRPKGPCKGPAKRRGPKDLCPTCHVGRIAKEELWERTCWNNAFSFGNNKYETGRHSIPHRRQPPSPAAPRTQWLGLVARGGGLLRRLRRRIYPTLLGLRVALGVGVGLPHRLRCTHHRCGVSIETHPAGYGKRAGVSKQKTHRLRRERRLRRPAAARAAAERPSRSSSSASPSVWAPPGQQRRRRRCSGRRRFGCRCAPPSMRAAPSRPSVAASADRPAGPPPADPLPCTHICQQSPVAQSPARCSSKAAWLSPGCGGWAPVSSIPNCMLYADQPASAAAAEPPPRCSSSCRRFSSSPPEDAEASGPATLETAWESTLSSETLPSSPVVEPEVLEAAAQPAALALAGPGAGALGARVPGYPQQQRSALRVGNSRTAQAERWGALTTRGGQHGGIGVGALHPRDGGRAVLSPESRGDGGPAVDHGVGDVVALRRVEQARPDEAHRLIKGNPPSASGREKAPLMLGRGESSLPARGVRIAVGIRRRCGAQTRACPARGSTRVTCPSSSRRDA